ncbi:MAG: putative LPS assembly protein LptD [candidate division WOR-3 bacterium]
MAFTVVWLLIGFSVTQDSAYKIVNYKAKTIIYYPCDEKVILLDSAIVNYGELTVSADSIEYEISKKKLRAYKNVRFTTATDIIYGQALFYNVATKKGHMVNAETKLENGIVRGKNVWLVKAKTLHIRDGYYTTCDHEPPHYYFYSPKSKVLVDNTAFAQPVVLKIFGIPCAMAPFWFFPVSRQRKSGLLPFKFGQSKSEGRYAKGVAYYLVLNDYSDITFSCDILEKKGIQPKIELIYLVTPLASGQMFLSYIRELDSKRERYSINAKHRSIFLLNSELNSYIDFQSDENYLPDYPENRAQWLKKELYSQITLTREIKKIGRFSLRGERKDDFRNRSTNWKLPSFSFNFYRLPLTRTWNLSPGIGYLRTKNTSYLNSFKRIYQTNTWTVRFNLANPHTFLGNFELPINFSFGRVSDYYKDSLIVGYYKLQVSSGFSFTQTILQSLFLSQALDYNQDIIYYKNDSTLLNALLGLNLNFGSNFYRLFGISLGELKNVLHRMTPTININYSPYMANYRYLFYPKFDTPPNTARINFSLNNFLEGKFETTNAKRELATIDFNSSYDFLSRGFAPFNVISDLYWISRPYTQLFTNVNLSFPATGKFNLGHLNLNINTNFNLEFLKKDSTNHLERGFKLNINHYFSTSVEESFLSTNNMINLTASIIPKGFRIDFTTGINFKERTKVTNYNITIWKDLHCWEAIMEINRFGAIWSYDFKIRIKKIPDVSFSKGMLDFILPF